MSKLPTLSREKAQAGSRKEGEAEAKSSSPKIAFPKAPLDPNDSAAEQYRIISTKISHHPLQPRILLVSSPMSGDGKTTTAINLAVFLSLQDVPVLLVDGNFHRSTASAIFGATSRSGFSEVLRRELPLDRAVLSFPGFHNLSFLPCGAMAGPSAELFKSNWPSLRELIGSKFHFVVFDGPSIGVAAEYELLQLVCDGALLVIRQDHTNRELCKKALQSIPKDKQLGLILNGVEPWWLWKTAS